MLSFLGSLYQNKMFGFAVGKIISLREFFNLQLFARLQNEETKNGLIIMILIKKESYPNRCVQYKIRFRDQF